MNIIFVSECSGKARETSRKILDRYCSRIGSDAWEATLSEEGLSTIHSLLRSKHSRLMSVACHRISYHGHRVLMWVVGNKKRFSFSGEVSTGWTERHLPSGDFSANPSIRLLNLVVTLSGLLHDIGKGLAAFQGLLRGKSSEAARHEWLSGEILLALLSVKSLSEIIDDRSWCSVLQTSVSGDAVSSSLNLRMKEWNPTCLKKTFLDAATQQRVPVLASLWWLMVSHHRLTDGIASFSQSTLTCGHAHLRSSADMGAWSDCRLFQHKGQPWDNEFWRQRFFETLKKIELIFKDFPDASLHVDAVRIFGRFALLLADQSVSSQSVPCVLPLTQQKVMAYANTIRSSSVQSLLMTRSGNTAQSFFPSQLLPRHLLDVSRSAMRAMEWLPKLRAQLPAIETDSLPPLFRKQAPPRFAWQTESIRLLRSRASDIQKGAFFGLMVAGTGSGKTVAAPRILAALSTQGLRLTYTSPTRILTLQAWDKLRAQGFEKDQCAAIIGDSMVFDLFQANKEKDPSLDDPDHEEDFPLSVAGGLGVVPDDFETQFPLMRQLKNRERKILCTPILSATLDTLMKMADTRRAGHILHGLRLMSSDLIIDEVASYAPADLMAIGRLLEVAGFWRVNVILASATLPPSVALGLFTAWRAGLSRRSDLEGTILPAYVGWMSDATSPHCCLVDNLFLFESLHGAFVTKVGQTLRDRPSLRSIGFEGSDVPLGKVPGFVSGESFVEVYANLRRGIGQLHQVHAFDTGHGKRVSVGCLQVVNVSDCQWLSVALARDGVGIPGLSVKIVCLHARLSLVMRNLIESRLDRMLLRASGDRAPLIDADLSDALHTSSGDVVVIVVSTMEATGRDHDYDWGILESRDFGTIVQFAGRIRRHRSESPPGNLLLLDRPLRYWRTLNRIKKDKGTVFRWHGVNDPVGSGDIRLESRSVANEGRLSTMLEGLFRIKDDGFRIVNNELSLSVLSESESGLKNGIFAIERQRLFLAMIQGGSENSPLAITEWVNASCPLVRMSSWHADSFRFRASIGKNDALVWQEEEGWFAKMADCRKHDIVVVKWTIPGAIKVNESGFLFAYDLRQLLDDLGTQVEVPSEERPMKLGCIRVREPNKEWFYHSLIGMVDSKIYCSQEF